MSLEYPNYHEIPNLLVDTYLKILTHVELKVLLIIIRKTKGWDKDDDWISLSQLQEISGSSRSSVVRAIKGLLKHDLINKKTEGKNGDKQSRFSIKFKSRTGSMVEPPTGSMVEPPTGSMVEPTKETYTKETYTKEKEREKEKGASPPIPPPPLFLWKKIKMKQKEYDVLVVDFGEAKVREYLEKLDEYGEIKAKKFKEYSSHAAVIRQWLRRDSQQKASRISEEVEVIEINRKYITQFKEKFGLGEICIGKKYVQDLSDNTKEWPLNLFPETFKNAIIQHFKTKYPNGPK